MMEADRVSGEAPMLLDAVALLTERSAESLLCGQVGTVVELLDMEAVLVEFGNDGGRPYAVVPVLVSDLMVLRYAPEFGSPGFLDS